jgi:hypothetical protein
MSRQENRPTSRAGAAALVTVALVSVGATAAQSGIDSKIADVARMSLSKLKSVEDSVFANSVRAVREGSSTEILAMAFNN